MKWFRSWLRKQVSKAVDEENKASQGICLSSTVREDDLGCDKEIRFTLKLAEGGCVLSTYQYDRQKDRSFQKLLVIPEDRDVSEAVGQHVAMEIMRA